MSLLNFFNPFGGALQPGAGFGGYTPMMPAPDDGRTNYTGQIGADQYNQAGNVNNNADPSNGAKLGPTGMNPDGSHYGPIPFGGWSQLGSVLNGINSGYAPEYRPGAQASQFDPYAGDIDGRPLSGPNGVIAPPVPEPNSAPRGTPKPNEPNMPNAQPMMGQWGGGGWNVGSGAPASAQPMWLGSLNGGQSWAQAPGYNTRAPQQGQQTSMWHTAPNQDADSPTWVQRG
jgi:hypothetical protein